MNSSLDQEYAGIQAAHGAFNKAQTNPLHLPNGFYLVESPKGDSLGFGFYCATCKINIPGRAPETVKHCGKVSTMPVGMNDPAKLNFRKLRAVKNWLKFWRHISEGRTVVLKSSS
jgi:hypothetical protein